MVCALEILCLTVPLLILSEKRRKKGDQDKRKADMAKKLKEKDRTDEDKKDREGRRQLNEGAQGK